MSGEMSGDNYSLNLNISQLQEKVNKRERGSLPEKTADSSKRAVRVKSGAKKEKA